MSDLLRASFSRSPGGLYLCVAAILQSLACDAIGGIAVKKQLVVILTAILIAGSFISFEARAQERAGSAALGAVSGAVVLGPVGAVAGALIGYTAGPAIAHSWGVGHSASRSRGRRVKQARLGAQELGSKEHGTKEAGTQGQRTQAQGNQASATQEQAAAKISPPPSAKTTETPAGTKAAPPVQGFE